MFILVTLLIQKLK